MIRSLPALLCLAGLVASGPGRAQTAAAPTAPAAVSLRIHFAQGEAWAPLTYETVKGVILIKAEINGRPVTLLLDNGSDRTLVDTGFAERAGIRMGVPATNAITGSAARLATRATESLVFAVPRAITVTGPLVAVDLTPMSTALGREVDGVLGADVLNNLAVMIDPDKTLISIVGSGDIAPGANAIVIPVGERNLVNVTINGQPVRLKLDIGFNGVARLTDPAWHRAFADGAPVRPDSQITADGVKRSTPIADGEMQIGDIVVKDAPINGGYVRTDADGILGNRFMSRFVTIFDGPKKQFILVPRSKPAL